MTKSSKSWSVPIAIGEIPETGLHIEIEAPAEARAALGALAGLWALPQLSAVFDLTRSGARVHVSGVVQARVGQTCVVTLEPIENTIVEPVDLLFSPAAAGAGERQPTGGDAEPPEPLADDHIDLAAVAAEFLMLGIDPYPRKPGAEFTPPRADEASEHPFAALAVLKKRFGDR